MQLFILGITLGYIIWYTGCLYFDFRRLSNQSSSNAVEEIDVSTIAKQADKPVKVSVEEQNSSSPPTPIAPTPSQIEDSTPKYNPTNTNSLEVTQQVKPTEENKKSIPDPGESDMSKFQVVVPTIQEEKSPVEMEAELNSTSSNIETNVVTQNEKAHIDRL